MSVQVSVESLSKCSWTGCPSAHGIPTLGLFFRFVLPHLLSDAQRYGIDERGVAQTPDYLRRKREANQRDDLGLVIACGLLEKIVAGMKVGADLKTDRAIAAVASLADDVYWSQFSLKATDVLKNAQSGKKVSFEEHAKNDLLLNIAHLREMI